MILLLPDNVPLTELVTPDEGNKVMTPVFLLIPSTSGTPSIFDPLTVIPIPMVGILFTGTAIVLPIPPVAVTVVVNPTLI